MKSILNMITLFSLLWSLDIHSQSEVYRKDSVMLREIYSEILENGQAYEDLRVLCKDIGARLSGSLGEKMAVQWGFQTLLKSNFDTVYLQEVMVPHWERGTKETGYYTDKNGTIHPMNLLALGGSIATDGILEGDIVMFKSREELNRAQHKQVEGKIVFLAEHMSQKNINTFHSYSEDASIRTRTAIEASKKGAIAVLTRSLSLSENEYPNTGGMYYEEGVQKIPAATLSTKDATALEKLIDSGEKKITCYIQLNCKSFPDKKSYNVIGEIKGSTYPNNFITVGGHLDSWDVSEGAHDDGAGIVQSMEALRALINLGYKPKNTLRVVFFMNEENGGRGGKMYAEKSKENNENHIYAIESDAGGFTPHGFSIQDHPATLDLVKSFKSLFQPYYIHYIKSGYSGADIGHLKFSHDNIGLIGLVPDSQRYFDIHHNANDVFENVNKRELHLGAATMASLIYLLDSHYSE